MFSTPSVSLPNNVPHEGHFTAIMVTHLQVSNRLVEVRIRYPILTELIPEFIAHPFTYTVRVKPLDNEVNIVLSRNSHISTDGLVRS